MPQGCPENADRCTICNTRSGRTSTGDCNRDQPPLITARFKVLADAAWRHGSRASDLRDPRRAGDKGAGARGRHARFCSRKGLACRTLKAIRGPLFGMFLAAVDLATRERTTREQRSRFPALHESLGAEREIDRELVPHAGVSITNVLLSPGFMRLRAELLRVGRYPRGAGELRSVPRPGTDDALPAPGDRLARVLPVKDPSP